MTFEEYLAHVGFDPQTGKDPYGRSMKQIAHHVQEFGADLATQEERSEVRQAASRWQSQNSPAVVPDQNGMGSDGYQRTPTNTAPHDPNDPTTWQGSGSHDTAGNPTTPTTTPTTNIDGLLGDLFAPPEQTPTTPINYMDMQQGNQQSVGIQTPDYGQPQMRNPMEFAQQAANPMPMQYNPNVNNMHNAAKDWKPQYEGLLASIQGNLL